MKLEHPVRLWRAAVWLLCVVVLGYVAVPLVWRGTGLVIYFVFGVPRVVTAAKEWEWLSSMQWLGWGFPKYWYVLGRDGYSDREALTYVWNRIADMHYPWWFLPLAAMCSVSPAMFTLAPWTRARAKVELRHVGRWWLYGQGWVVVMFAWMIAVSVLTAVQEQASSALGPLMLGVSSSVAVPAPGLVLVPRAFYWYDQLSYAAFPMRSEVMMPLAWFGWLCWWNWNALKRGMRLEGIAFGVWWVLMVPTVLVGVLVAVMGVFVLGILVPGVG